MPRISKTKATPAKLLAIAKAKSKSNRPLPKFDIMDLVGIWPDIGDGLEAQNRVRYGLKE